MLTTGSLPIVPTTSQEVVQSGYSLLLTTSAILVVRGDKQVELSAAKEHILLQKPWRREVEKKEFEFVSTTA